MPLFKSLVLSYNCELIPIPFPFSLHFIPLFHIPFHSLLIYFPFPLALVSPFLLLSSMQIHPVFHVSLLELHVENTFLGRIGEVPLPIQVDGLPQFEVDTILDSRFRRRKRHYLVD